MPLGRIVIAGALAVGAGGVALADDYAPPAGHAPLAPLPPANAPLAPGAEQDLCLPAPPPCRIEVIPARCEYVEREIVVPAVTDICRVPVYTDVEVPVYEQICEPRYEEVRVPRYETREVPVYAEQCVPVYGDVQVPIYRTEKRPVTITVWNPFKCEDEEIELWEECEDVLCGYETRQGVVGERTERVQVGTRTEQYIAGYETQQVLAGHVTRQVQSGTRTERRLTGYPTETVVVRPAQDARRPGPHRPPRAPRDGRCR